MNMNAADDDASRPEPPPSPTPAAVTDIDWRGLGCSTNDPFTLTLEVGAAHMGRAIPHVPNTEYVCWMEVAAVSHSNSLGYTEAWHRSERMMWFVRRHEIDYLGEVFNGDRIVVATWVEAMEKARSERRYLIYRPSDEATILRGTTVWVLVSTKTRRPLRIPEEMTRRYMPHR